MARVGKCEKQLQVHRVAFLKINKKTKYKKACFQGHLASHYALLLDGIESNRLSFSCGLKLHVVT
jgi:hypothetical protein